jgi:hypothetical protein
MAIQDNEVNAGVSQLQLRSFQLEFEILDESYVLTADPTDKNLIEQMRHRVIDRLIQAILNPQNLPDYGGLLLNPEISPIERDAYGLLAIHLVKSAELTDNESTRNRCLVINNLMRAHMNTRVNGSYVHMVPTTVSV